MLIFHGKPLVKVVDALFCAHSLISARIFCRMSIHALLYIRYTYISLSISSQVALLVLFRQQITIICNIARSSRHLRIDYAKPFRHSFK